jgi:indole-3-glycerol phosphate synthase
MQSILDKIVAGKRKEVAERRSSLPAALLERQHHFDRKCLSLKDSLLKSPSGIIAEFKRKSPSKGWIHQHADVHAVVSAYSSNGASGISILTDFPFFGGTPEDLIRTRSLISCPVLRKDFIIDEYQLFEAKSFGADAVLLIAAVLTPGECRKLARRARELGMEVLLEIHNREEAGHIADDVDIAGINNRDLKTFNVSVDTSLALAEHIPKGFVKISESGISGVAAVRLLREAGFNGFLMGENFMKESDPAAALKNFIDCL